MFISPMLLHKTDPFDNEDWLTELKLDGIRLVYSNEDKIQMFTRHNNEVSLKFPELKGKLPNCYLDGEVVLTNSEGKPDFEALMSRFMVNNPQKTQQLAGTFPVTYCVFDILRFEGKDLTNLPLIKRKEILNKVLPDLDRVVKVQYVQGQGKGFFEAIKKQHLEGIVLKKANSKYCPGSRSVQWLKAINYSYENVYITGYKKAGFGWLLAFENGRPAGLMELGIPNEARNAVRLLISELKVSESKDYIYFRPALKCMVKYRNLTKAGLLRLPSFVKFMF